MIVRQTDKAYWRTSHAALITVIVLGLFTLAPAKVLRHEARAADPNLEEYLWQGWRAEREKLATGRFRGKGQGVLLQRVRTEAGEIEFRPLREFPIAFEMVFDWTSDALKFHFTEWDFDPKDWEREVKGIWAQSDDRLVQWLDQGAGTHASIQFREEERFSWARLIDPRLVGLVGPTAYGGSGISFEAGLRERDELRSLLSLLSISEVSPGRFELVYDGEYGGGSTLRLRRHYVINESRGFTIESRKTVNYVADRETTVADATATWRQWNGVWVPEALNHHGTQALSGIQLDFTWDEVNEPIAASEFELENLGISRGIVVYDHRFDPPVRLGRIGDPLWVGPVEPTGGMQLRLTSWLLIGANIVLAMGLLAGFVYRRLRSNA